MNDFMTGIKDYIVGGCISCDDFFKYYSDVNAVLPAEREAYFIELVLKSWSISPKAVQVAGDKSGQLEDVLFEKIR